MSAELNMPALSPTMEKGTLARWLVKEGDIVQAGDPLAEIETDKASMEVEAPDAGVIAKILVAEGTEDVLVGAAIALLTAQGDEEAPLRPVIESAPSKPMPERSSPAPASNAAERLTPQPIVIPPTASIQPVKASPLARRIAEARGLDLVGVVGSGPRGKIITADLGLPEPQPATATATATPAPAAAVVFSRPPADMPFEAIKLSGMRKTIARRLTEAKQLAPHFYLGVDVRLDTLLRLREELNASLAERGVKLSVNDFLIKALAIALERAPDANVQFAGDELYRFSRVDVSVAVAVPGGLLTPVVKDAAGKRLSVIAAETKDFATRAREGRLAPEEYQGGTVSISNLGMFGMRTVIPVINTPQALIVGVGAAEERAIVADGEISRATVVAINASFDHRAIDGATGADLLRAFKTLVERPIALLT